MSSRGARCSKPLRGRTPYFCAGVRLLRSPRRPSRRSGGHELQDVLGGVLGSRPSWRSRSGSCRRRRCGGSTPLPAAAADRGPPGREPCRSRPAWRAHRALRSSRQGAKRWRSVCTASAVALQPVVWAARQALKTRRPVSLSLPSPRRTWSGIPGSSPLTFALARQRSVRAWSPPPPIRLRSPASTVSGSRTRAGAARPGP